MAVTEDASTPAVATTAGGSTATSLASASFSPPAGSVLAALCVLNWNSLPGTIPSFTLSDSASGTWTAGPVIEYGVAFQKAQIFTRPVVTAPGSITVTFARGADSSAAMLMLGVRVCDGANVTSPQGASNTASATRSGSTTNIAAAVTPTQIGSLLYVAGGGSGSATFTALSGTTTIQSTHDSADGGVLSVGKSGPVTSLTSQSPGWSAPLVSGAGWIAAVLEIVPASAPASPTGLLMATGF